MIEFILIRNPNEILRVKLSKLGFHFQNFIPSLVYYKKRPGQDIGHLYTRELAKLDDCTACSGCGRNSSVKKRRRSPPRGNRSTPDSSSNSSSPSCPLPGYPLPPQYKTPRPPLLSAFLSLISDVRITLFLLDFSFFSLSVSGWFLECSFAKCVCIEKPAASHLIFFSALHYSSLQFFEVGRES